MDLRFGKGIWYKKDRLLLPDVVSLLNLLHENTGKRPRSESLDYETVDVIICRDSNGGERAWIISIEDGPYEFSSYELTSEETKVEMALKRLSTEEVELLRKKFKNEFIKKYYESIG